MIRCYKSTSETVKSTIQISSLQTESKAAKKFKMLRNFRNASMMRSIGLVLFLLMILLFLRHKQTSNSLHKKELLSQEDEEYMPQSGEKKGKVETQKMNIDDNQRDSTATIDSKEHVYGKPSYGEKNSEREITKTISVANHTSRKEGDMVGENPFGDERYKSLEETNENIPENKSIEMEETEIHKKVETQISPLQTQPIPEQNQTSYLQKRVPFKEIINTYGDRTFTQNQAKQPSHPLSYNNTEILPECEPSDLKTIGWFRGKTVQDYSGTEMFIGCEYSCCTLEKVKVNTQEIDVMVFEAKSLHNLELPPRMTADQIWVFYSIEPDVKRLKNISTEWNDVFNWTLTYRDDSDIYMPYMTVERDKKPVVRDYGQIISMKDKKSIWIENRCKMHSTSKANDYVTILKKYIDVDLFGMLCPTVEIGCINYCHDMFERYKFAFAFEPLLCKDFITHQFCEILQHNIVPVVRGVGNYSQFAPKSSFINTEDFESIEELGQYLNYLDTNHTAYAEYLQNKEGFRFNCVSVLTRKPAYCDLCKKAHHTNDNRKIIPNVFEWMSGECSEATDLIEKHYSHL